MPNFYIGMDVPDRPFQDKRKQPRIPFSGTGKILVEKKLVDITFSNISLSGLLFHAQPRLELGQELTLRVRGEHEGELFEEMVTGRIVAVHGGERGHSYGLQFVSHLSADVQPCLFTKIEQTLKQSRS